MRAVDELIDRIVNSAQIPSAKRRRDVWRELRCHIEDFVTRARESGRTENEIEALVLANFGDPAEIAGDFAWVYRNERRRLLAFAYSLSTVLLASGLFAAILAMQAGLAFGFGRPMVQVFASRHTVIEALDILASVAVYLGLVSLEGLFGSHRFHKAALVLTMIVTAVIASCTAAGVHIPFLSFGLINGLFFRAIQLFITPKAARIGIVVISFALCGFISALSRSQFAPLASCASWLIMGAGYQVMTYFAPRVDAALLNGLERIQASH